MTLRMTIIANTMLTQGNQILLLLPVNRVPC